MSFGFSTSSSNLFKDASINCDSVILSGPSFKNKLRALIVDDIKMNRMILTKHLASLGVESKEVENGKEAVDLFLAGSNFDLILMDKEMPVMNGPQATRELRSMGVCAKIVGMSSHSTCKEKHEFMEAGIDEYYVKPINHDKLIVLLQEVDAKR